jgi:hypothetical protein
MFLFNDQLRNTITDIQTILDNGEYGRWNPAISPTRGGRSVGVIRSRTEAKVFFFYYLYRYRTVIMQRVKTGDFQPYRPNECFETHDTDLYAKLLVISC